MLADYANRQTHAGKLREDLHLEQTALLELIDFIASQLPIWRDDSDRPAYSNENELTDQLNSHLNSVARDNKGFDIFNFSIEKPQKARKIDLVAKPSQARIVIAAKSYTKYDSLLCIECKRLPTPRGTDRDAREYVFSQYKSTGGIQRFKSGAHASADNLVAMIGYVQKETSQHWHSQINTWISELAIANSGEWSADDQLTLNSRNTKAKIARLHSCHTRCNNLTPINIHHMWIDMH